jgi:hypothetical protein
MINKYGNLGIGTHNPTAKLEVNGNVKVHGNTTSTVMSSNRQAVSMEHNILFNANNRYQVSITPSGSLDPVRLFDGRLQPSYPLVAPTPDNPIVVTVENLPNLHTQAGAWVGWTTRYWPAKNFKIEGYNTWSGAPIGWATIADYSDKDYHDSQFIQKTAIAGHHLYTKLRFTFYSARGVDGRLGVSELFFIHPEANRPYSGLLPSSMWEVDGNVGIGTANPNAKLDVRGSIKGQGFFHAKKDKDGEHYKATPLDCVEVCTSLGGRMATLAEMYAHASSKADICAWMWVLDNNNIGKVARGYPMYNNRTSSGCGPLNTGNVPRVVSPQVNLPWSTADKFDCGCHGIR